MTFKCKMCGGDITFESGESVGICDFCGTKQTLPKLDSDEKKNLYDRANHFRRNNEYDKAISIYEQILDMDTTDSEAYWSLVLCNYGIEYVDDPLSHRRVPTVNRAQFTSIFDDENYKAALKYSDNLQRSIYEDEARTINEIQKGILSISQKEDPFDVFICYKETDASGRRTIDSVLAYDLYNQLTQEGLKVFFSRVTLEDKLGIAYEPYIFAALNSAKVMVVIGTKKEYFEAAWVKNEWSRYLALVKKSQGKRILVPAYKDMDPYDLPEEFSHLQAQDMSKLGFMQDLIRGIKKIVKADEPQETPKEKAAIAGVSNVVPLLKRAFMSLEDCEWNKADDFCEQVLNQEPENAQAYLGKLMAELQVRRKEDLPNCERPFNDNNNYQKAVRFGDEEIAEMLCRCITHINERNENIRLTKIYNKAVADMKSADSESSYMAASAMFKTISGFKDADSLAEQCLERAGICRKDTVYKTAKLWMTKDTISGYETAIETFNTISGWKDADEEIRVCQGKIEQKKKQDEERRTVREKRAKKRKKAIAIALSTIVICGILMCLLIFVIIPNHKYNKAVELYNAGEYEEARWVLYDVKFKDISELLQECETAIKDEKYDEAIALLEEGDIIYAYNSLIELDGYRDSTQKADAIFVQYEMINMRTANVGDTVFYGKYGTEQIAWLVLEKTDNKLFIISKYVIDYQPFHTDKTSAYWANCTLRKWLNETFLNDAFSSEEQENIISSEVSGYESINHTYDTYAGTDTTDKVFLLGIKEIKKYFDSDNSRQCRGTDYCYKKAGYGNYYARPVYWWTRSLGYESHYVAFVDDAGQIDSHGKYSDGDKVGVRPVLWIDLGS